MKIDYTFIRPKRAEEIKKRTEYLKRKSISYGVFTNATILPLKKDYTNKLNFGYGGVIDEKGNYIESSGISRKKMWGKYEYSSSIKSEEKVVYLGIFIRHWGHFLVDSITRMWYYLHNDSSVDKYVFFAGEGINPKLDGNYKRFLELLGILDKVEIITVPTQYRTVIIPEISYQRGEWYSEEYTAVFQKVIDNALLSNSYENNCQHVDKIFLSRSQIRPVTEFGLEMLDDLFSKNGYKVVYPEIEDLGHLIILLNQSNEVATMGGTCFFNTLFSNNKKRITIIERRVDPNQNEIDLLKVMDSEVVLIDADLPIYTVDDFGPFIVFFNDKVSGYCEKYNMKKPNSHYYSTRYLKHLLRNYFRYYKKRYARKWYMQYGWYESIIDLFTEGYRDSCNYIGEYLSQEKPLFFKDYYNKKRLKSIAKIILKKKR